MAKKKDSGFAKVAIDASLAPQEATLEIKRKKGKLFIGIPKETNAQENRVGLTPDSVALLVNNGHKVVMEAKAGQKAHFSDINYTEAGAEIVHDVKEVFKADVIIKTALPTAKEIDLLHADQTLISPISLPHLKQDYIKKLLTKKVTALAFEYIKDEFGTFPIVRSMSEIGGSTAILIAAELLSDTSHGQGVLLGGIAGIPSAKIVILGAGIVGEVAARSAIGLGANVKVFDNSNYKLMRLQNNIGSQVYTSSINPTVLAEALKQADVVIGAIHSEHGRSPIIVTEEMVMDMKAGSILIDISIDQGGCFETSEITSHSKPTILKYDVIHYGVPNIPAKVSKTASHAISNVLTQMLMKGSDMGSLEKLIQSSDLARNGVYTYKGCLTNEHISEKFGIKFSNLDLLFAAGI